jgi:hypothetical protein
MLVPYLRRFFLEAGVLTWGPAIQDEEHRWGNLWNPAGKLAPSKKADIDMEDSPMFYCKLGDLLMYSEVWFRIRPTAM